MVKKLLIAVCSTIALALATEFIKWLERKLESDDTGNKPRIKGKVRSA